MRQPFSPRRTWRRYLAPLAGLALVATACGQGAGQPASAPTAAPAKPTSAPTAPSPAASAPAVATARPAQSATAGALQSAASSSAAAAAPAGIMRFSLAPSETEARFIARELLAANTVQSDAIGTTKEVSGEVLIAPNGQIADGSKVTVNLHSLKSDRDLRDNFIKRSTLQTSRFPNADFVPKEAQGLASPLPTSGQASFKLVGDMTVHGVTQPLTWEVTATFSGQHMSGRATTVVRLDTFGMRKPRVPLVASIEDDIRLELDFKATRST